MTCLIVGGGGFIGRWLAESLLASSRHVRAMGRSPSVANGLDRRIEYVCGDYGDPVVLKSAMTNVEEIVDLAYATVPKSSFEDPVFDIQSNLPKAVELLRVAAEFGSVRKIVMVSSGGTVYGHSTVELISEQHSTNPISPYGITKLAIEKYALMYRELFGLPVIIARPGNAYGEGQLPFRGQGFIATAAASILRGQAITLFGGDRVVRDYIHVEDLVAGLKSILDAGLPGHCYNVGTGVGHTTDQVLDLLMAAAGTAGDQIEVRREPLRPFDVLNNVLDSSLLHRHTGWLPMVPLEMGIERYWRWLSGADGKMSLHQ